MPEKPVIINNSPLVALWQLDHLALLRELYTKVLIPEEAESPRFIVGRGPVPRRAPGYPTLAGDRPPRYGCGGRLPFIVGRGPSPYDEIGVFYRSAGACPPRALE